MAKGIVVNPGTGGVPPKLIITDFDTTNRAAKPGKEIDLTSTTALGEGYLVQGTIAPNALGVLVFTVASVLDSAPNIVTSNQSGAVTIGSDQCYYVKTGGQITGNVNVNGGVLVVSGGTANGNISIAANSTIIGRSNATIGGGTFQVGGSGGNAVVVFDHCNVNGLFSTNGIHYVDLGGNTVNGSIRSDNDRIVTILNNTQTGNNRTLIVSNVVEECNISGNTGGTATLDPKCTV